MKKILLAITFLTRIPLPIPKKISPDDIGKSTPFFPIVGLLIGAILVGINHLCLYFWQPFVVNVILIVSMIIITGGLHLDGLMDTCDGIFSGKDRERMLEIMRDSRVGAMGVISAICLLALKFAFLSSINSNMKIPVLLSFPVMGRFSMVFVISVFPYARASSGLGSLNKEYSRKTHIFWASIQVLAVTIPLLLWKALPLFAIIFFISWFMGFRLSRRLGGLTGDTYGMICESIEAFSLVVMSLLFNPAISKFFGGI